MLISILARIVQGIPIRQLRRAQCLELSAVWMQFQLSGDELLWNRRLARYCSLRLARNSPEPPGSISAVLFQPPFPEPCLHLSAHTALQFPMICWAGDAHFTYHPRASWYSLPPFPMYQALPRSFEYYGGSVAMSVSACRRSRIDARQTLVRLGSPFVSFPHSLLGTHCKEPSTSYEITCYCSVVASDMLCVICFASKSLTATDACFRRWELGFNQFRLSLCHAHKTCGASQYISSCLTAFRICYFPPCLSTQGRSGVLGGHWLFSTCPSGAIRRAPKRRTHRTSVSHFTGNVKEIFCERVTTLPLPQTRKSHFLPMPRRAGDSVHSHVE